MDQDIPCQPIYGISGASPGFAGVKKRDFPVGIPRGVENLEVSGIDTARGNAITDEADTVGGLELGRGGFRGMERGSDRNDSQTEAAESTGD
jgi:hypothetical protein